MIDFTWRDLRVLIVVIVTFLFLRWAFYLFSVWRYRPSRLTVETFINKPEPIEGEEMKDADTNAGLFVRVPIDYRGNSPRFEYRPVTQGELERLGHKIRWCWEHRAFAPPWGDCDVRRNAKDVGYGPRSHKCIILDSVVVPTSWPSFEFSSEIESLGKVWQ